MTKTQSDAPIRLPSAQQVKALLKEGSRVKEKMSEIAGTYGDRVKSAIENGNLHGAAFGKAKSIYTKGRTNELAALEQMYHLRVYLDWIEEDIKNKGHVGNLDDQAKQAATEAPPEPQSAAAAAEALFKKQDDETEATRAAAREALDLPADGSAAAPPPLADAAEKPKRTRKAKAADANEEAAPPPPPAAVPKLADDDDEDIRPGFLKAKDAERKAAAVH